MKTISNVQSKQENEGEQLQSKFLIVTPNKFLKLSGFLTFFFLICHLIGIYAINKYPHLHIAHMIDKFFNLDEEATFPAFFSSVLLLLSAILLFVISTEKKGEKYYRRWQVLGFVFLFLCLDEIISIHEEVAVEVQLRLFDQRGFGDLNGFFYYSWVIPYAVFFLVVALYFFKFVLSLPPKIRNLFILAGCVYVSGALGCELIEGFYKKNYPGNSSMMGLYVVIEEIFEMLGITIFVYALLLHVASLKIKFDFSESLSSNQNKKKDPI
jgi:hypothetical protein